MAEISEELSEEAYQELLHGAALDVLDVALEASGLHGHVAYVTLFEQRPRTLAALARVKELLEALDEQGLPLEAWQDAAVVLQFDSAPLRLASADGERLTLLDVLEAAHFAPPPAERLNSAAAERLRALPAWLALEQELVTLVQRGSRFRHKLA